MPRHFAPVGLRSVTLIPVIIIGAFLIVFSGSGIIQAQSTPPASPAELSAGCDRGNTASCRGLAGLYLTGNGVPKDEMRAAVLYQSACDRALIPACIDLGGLYLNGRGLPKDEARAAAIFQQVCDSTAVGIAVIGCNALGILYMDGVGVAKDYARAAALFRKGCDGGLADAYANLAQMYATGRGVPQDNVQAAALYRRACDANLAVGCTNLGLQYENGVGLAKDEAKSIDLYQKACQAGDQTGCARLSALSARIRNAPAAAPPLVNPAPAPLPTSAASAPAARGPAPPAPTPELLLDQAKREFDVFHNEQAVTLLDRVIAMLSAGGQIQRPQLLTQAFELRGRARFNLGNSFEAEQDFSAVLLIDPAYKLDGGVSVRVRDLFESVRKLTIGQVSLSMTPPGDVEIDGKIFVAQAVPRTLDFAVGEHQVSVLRPLYRPVSRKFSIVAGEVVALELTLQRTSSTLNVISVPEGAEVVLDGTPRGQTAKIAGASDGSASLLLTDLGTGVHRLQLSRSCYRAVETTVQISEHGDLKTGPLSLIPAVATVRFKATDGTSLLYVDGALRGQLPPEFTLCEGRHKIEVWGAQGRFVDTRDWKMGDATTVSPVFRRAFPIVAVRNDTSTPTDQLRANVANALASAKNVLVYVPAQAELDTALREVNPPAGWLTPGGPPAVAAEARRDFGARLAVRLLGQGVAAISAESDPSVVSVSLLAAGSGEPEVMTIDLASAASRSHAIDVLGIAIPPSSATAPLTSTLEEDSAKLRLEASRTAARQGNYAEALKGFRAVALSATPVADDALFEIARYYFDVDRDAKEASAAVDTILKKYPLSNSAPDAYFLAGRLALARGRSRADIDAALANFGRVPQSFPASDAAPRALLEMATCYLDMLGDMKSAAGALDRILKDYPKSDAAPDARLLTALHSPDDRSVKSSPRSASEQVAVTLFLSGQYAKAVDTLTSAGSGPMSPSAYFYFACSRTALVLTRQLDPSALVGARTALAQAGGAARFAADLPYISPRILQTLEATDARRSRTSSSGK